MSNSVEMSLIIVFRVSMNVKTDLELDKDSHGDTLSGTIRRETIRITPRRTKRREQQCTPVLHILHTSVVQHSPAVFVS